MGNNLFANVPASVTAKQSADFDDLDFTPDKIDTIIEPGASPKSFRPGALINTLSKFTKDRGYYIKPKLNMDLSEILAGPILNPFTVVAPLVLNQQDFQNLVFFDNAGSVSKTINAFSLLEFETDATTVTITVVSQLFGSSLPGANGASLYINDIYTQRLVPSSNDTAQNFVIDLSELGGNNNIKIVTSTNESGTQAVVPIKLTFPLFSNVTIIKNYKKPNQLVTITDSIGVGVGASIPEQFGYVPRLKVIKSNWDIVPIGFGGSKFADFFDSTNLPVTRQRLKMRLTGAVKKHVYIALGTNDFGASPQTSVSTIQSLLVAALDAFHTDFPSAKIFVQTPTLLTSETSAMTNIRNGIVTTVNSRSGFASVISGPSLVATNKLVDGVHPNDSGYLDMTNNLVSSNLFN